MVERSTSRRSLAKSTFTCSIQLLRGRITPAMRVLDAGCGSGRNLVYLMRAGHDVCATDVDPVAISTVAAGAFAGAAPATRRTFRGRTGGADDVCRRMCRRRHFRYAVLHFAGDDAQFLAMVRDMWRVLHGEGLFFCRLASTIGIGLDAAAGGRRFLLPDGSERYLADESLLVDLTWQLLGGRLIDRLNQWSRINDCMTTWVACKQG